jgi:thiol-disulfide isomerase/thioredoxin
VALLSRAPAHPNDTEISTMNPTTPRLRFRLAAATIVAASVLAACGSSETDEASSATEAMADETATTEAMVDEAMTEDSMVDEAMTDEAMVDEAMTEDSMVDEAMTEDSMVDEAMTEEAMTEDSMVDDAMALPAWQTIALTDVDGATFTLDDFHGTPVFVETFATWCPNCKKQLEDTNTAAEQLGDQAVFIALSVETDLSSADVAEYAADNGFDAIRFAFMTPEALAAFVEGLGQSAANPPSTPKVVIDPMGHAGELTTGFESVDDIVAKVTGQG